MNPKLKETFELVAKHKGHIVAYSDQVGSQELEGTVARVSVDEHTHAIWLWLAAEPFPKRIAFERVWRCKTCNGMGDPR